MNDQTVTIDSTFQTFIIKTHSLQGIGPNDLKNLIQTKYKVLEITETHKSNTLINFKGIVP